MYLGIEENTCCNHKNGAAASRNNYKNREFTTPTRVDVIELLLIGWIASNSVCSRPCK